MSNVKVSNKAQKIRSIKKEKRLSGSAASFRKLQKVLRSLLKKVEELRKEAVKYNSRIPDEAKNGAEIIGIPFIVQLANLLEYITLINYDLAYLFEEMAITRSRWKKKLYARLIVINLYECIDDLDFLLGRPLKEQLMVMLLPNLEDARRTFHKEIVKFNKSHNAFLKSIRNSVIAHRDHNAESQIEFINSLKAIKIYQLGTEFFTLTSNFVVLLSSPLLKELSARMSLLSKKK